jgi:CRP-like cAMP-binding protein
VGGAHPARQNRLLAALPTEAFAFLRDSLVPTPLAQGQVLYEQYDPLHEAIFIHEGSVSIVTVMDDGRSTESATIGPEGYVGFTGQLGDRTAIQRYVVQVAGSGSRLSLRTLDETITRFPMVLDLLLRYSKALIAQSLQLVACNSLHSAEQRCCRWLTMTHDRVSGDSFGIKQDELAKLLGVRRATVSEICNALQREGTIRYSRGFITILEPSRIEAQACECHDAIRRAYRHLLPGA